MPSNPPEPLPALTSAQAAEVDRLCAGSLGLPVEWLMEAAGWQLARMCRGRTQVVCGKGNNGGDGLAAARHLHRWGRLAGVSCSDRAALSGPALREAEALEAMGVAIAAEPALGGAHIVLDAVLGTGLRMALEGRAAELVAAINRARAGGARVVAVDVPSGLDSDSGAAPGACVEADVTLTLGLPKAGLLLADGLRLAGEVWVADIGIPAAAYAAVGVTVPAHLFSMHDRVQLAALRL